MVNGRPTPNFLAAAIDLNENVVLELIRGDRKVRYTLRPQNYRVAVWFSVKVMMYETEIRIEKFPDNISIPIKFSDTLLFYGVSRGIENILMAQLNENTPPSERLRIFCHGQMRAMWIGPAVDLASVHVQKDYAFLATRGIKRIARVGEIGFIYGESGGITVGPDQAADDCRTTNANKATANNGFRIKFSPIIARPVSRRN